MRYLALASDYDGTLAHDGVVDEQTVRALERLTHSGRKLILVHGARSTRSPIVFSRLDLCAHIVAENSAVLYNPATREKTILTDRPPESFIENLRTRGVNNISIGDVIAATWHPFEQQVLDGIRESGLALQIIFNKDAVMVLPSGTNKMTGLCSALEELKVSPHNVIGIGDAENDHAFLNSCECAIAPNRRCEHRRIVNKGSQFMSHDGKGPYSLHPTSRASHQPGKDAGDHVREDDANLRSLCVLRLWYPTRDSHAIMPIGRGRLKSSAPSVRDRFSGSAGYL